MSDGQAATGGARAVTTHGAEEGSAVLSEAQAAETKTVKFYRSLAQPTTVETSQPQKEPALRPVRSEQMRLRLLAARDELRRELADPNRTYAPVGKRKPSRI